MSQLNEAISLIKGAQHIAICAHIAPDPDAIGSLLGFGLGLKNIGKNVTLLCDDPVPSNLRFLPDSQHVQQQYNKHQSINLFIGLDASDASRLGKAGETYLNSTHPSIIIDHHITNEYYGDVNVVNPECASTAEVLIPVLDALDITITTDIATCLFAAIIGDTRNFATASVTPNTFKTSARLLEAGADTASIIEKVFNHKTYKELVQWGIGLTNAQLEDGIIWAVISMRERRDKHINDTQIKGFSSLLLSAEEANIAASLVEQANGEVAVSMRARPGYDVAQTALSLGGGGHTLAAGCTLAGPLEEAIQIVVSHLKQHAQPKTDE